MDVGNLPNHVKLLCLSWCRYFGLFWLSLSTFVFVLSCTTSNIRAQVTLGLFGGSRSIWEARLGFQLVRKVGSFLVKLLSFLRFGSILRLFPHWLLVC